MTRCQLCDCQGVRMCGTDGLIYVDGRFSITHILYEVKKYKAGFKKNFKHKYEYWTHVQIRGVLYNIN